jgi:hypothetical protein
MLLWLSCAWEWEGLRNSCRSSSLRYSDFLHYCFNCFILQYNSSYSN